MFEVALKSSIGGRTRAVLRELNGYDEIFVAANRPSAAPELVDRLLVASYDRDAVAPGDAATVALADLDRILAALYIELFGAHVEGRATCSACGEEFEASFSLLDLRAHLDASAAAADRPDETGYFAWGSGARFRMPTTEDFRAARAAGGDVADQIARVAEACLRGPGEVDPSGLQAAMERVGPTYDLEISAACVECDATQLVPFDVRSYLFAAIRNDAAWRIRETHAIARAYGWGRAEIMELARSERRAFVALIAAEAQPRRSLLA